MTLFCRMVARAGTMHVTSHWLYQIPKRLFQSTELKAQNISVISQWPSPLQLRTAVDLEKFTSPAMPCQEKRSSHAIWEHSQLTSVTWTSDTSRIEIDTPTVDFLTFLNSISKRSQKAPRNWIRSSRHALTALIWMHTWSMLERSCWKVQLI